MIKHHEQGNLEKKTLNLGLTVSEVRVHDGGAKAWQQEQLRLNLDVQFVGEEGDQPQ